jgi:hypothetical protein
MPHGWSIGAASAEGAFRPLPQYFMLKLELSGLEPA